MDQMGKWLEQIFEAGGSPADLRPAWSAWQPMARNEKLPLVEHYEALLRRSELREIELAAKKRWGDPSTALRRALSRQTLSRRGGAR
jgi:hypothetical protein